MRKDTGIQDGVWAGWQDTYPDGLDWFFFCLDLDLDLDLKVGNI